MAWTASEERRRYWQSLPLSAFAWIALTAFLTFASVGLAANLVDGLQWPFWWVLAKSAFFGALTALSFAIILRNRKARFLILIPVLVLLAVLPRIQSGFPANKILMDPGFEYVRWRLATVGMLSSAAAAIGYAVFVIFAGTQGVKHVRVRTELELAEKLQQTLAPPLAARNAAYEILGRSVPSSQMGGDLLDAVDDCGAMACYVADVAGHGIQAGVFMGMVKSSARTALLRPRPLEELLADLNKVLFDVKGASPTYVTFACLRCGEGGKVEYTLAGNGPILHYRAQQRSVSQLAMEQFPLGLFANATFASGTVKVEPGDILALLTDGLPEVEDANHEQFGLERIGKIVARNADGPLADLTETLFAAVRQFGRQTDDETLVLVRAGQFGSDV
jgi:Stage II sporulation protein E (SpoIIE)